MSRVVDSYDCMPEDGGGRQPELDNLPRVQTTNIEHLAIAESKREKMKQN